MGNKILNQLYHSCNVTWVMPCKNTSFLKLWPCEVLTTHDCSMACCCMLFGISQDLLLIHLWKPGLRSPNICYFTPSLRWCCCWGFWCLRDVTDQCQSCWSQHLKPNIWAALSPSHPSACHHMDAGHRFMFPRYNPGFTFVPHASRIAHSEKD